MSEKEYSQEWIDSVLDPELVKPDVKSKQKRRNDKGVQDKILDRYLQLLEKDSYRGSGIDVFKGDDSPWGQFKPDTPFCDHKSAKSLTPDFEQLEECAERNHNRNLVRRKYEQEKNIWIQRFWQTSSQDISAMGVQQSGRTEPHSTLLQSKTRQATTTERRENETPKNSTICLGEFPAACGRRKYDQINRILRAVWNRQRHGSTQLKNSDSRRIERLIQVVAQYFSINKAIGKSPATEGGKADA